MKLTGSVMKNLLIALSFILFFTACNTQEEPSISVYLQADGRERAWQVPEPLTVQEFLEGIDEEVGALDRMQPEPWTQIYDDLRITIVRVSEEEYCEEDVEIPYREQRVPFEGVDPGEERIAQRGENGLERVCYRVLVEDGVRQEPVEISRTVVQEPQDQIIWVGPTGELEPVAVSGTLAYLSNNNAWVIQGNSRNKRNLTIEGDLDDRVYSLSADGRKLLFARRIDVEGLEGNELWLMPDITREDVQPIPLAYQNVLYAEWVPGYENTIAYSTFRPQAVSPGWTALNDLWRVRVDPQTGQQIDIDSLLEDFYGGPYSWWGTQFEWSPDGNRLAWVQADGIGLVSLDEGELGPRLLEYTELNPGVVDWSWRSSVSWSPDSSLLAATVHGPPIGNEPPANSPVFNIAVTAVDGSFATEIINRAGIWSEPSFSPEIRNPASQYQQGYIAYFQAREWENSISGEYDLIIADRDGSNARIIFPESSAQRGITEQQMTWHPDGQDIAFIYQGNLWIVDVESEVAHQLTQDGGASNPIWVQ